MSGPREPRTPFLFKTQIGIESARTAVEQGLYQSRWERATQTQSAFMSAMAIDDDAPSSMAELVTRLQKKRTTDLSVNRRDLIRSNHCPKPPTLPRRVCINDPKNHPQPVLHRLTNTDQGRDGLRESFSG